MALGRKRSKFIYNPIFIFLLLFLTIVTIVGLTDLIKKNQEATKNKNIAEEELNQLKERVSQIQKKINNLSTPLGIEETIREKFSLKKPGEEEVIITDEKVEEPAQTKKSFWNFLKNIF